MHDRLRPMFTLALGAAIGAATVMLLNPQAGDATHGGTHHNPGGHASPGPDVNLPFHIKNCVNDNCTESHNWDDLGNGKFQFAITNVPSNMSVNGGGYAGPTKGMLSVSFRGHTVTRQGYVFTIPEEARPGDRPERQQSIYFFDDGKPANSPDNVIIVTCPYRAADSSGYVPPCT